MDNQMNTEIKNFSRFIKKRPSFAKALEETGLDVDSMVGALTSRNKKKALVSIALITALNELIPRKISSDSAQVMEQHGLFHPRWHPPDNSSIDDVDHSLEED
jgi:hypothetical protein